MNSPSDELTAIRRELEQFRQDFIASRNNLQKQIATGIIGGVIGTVIIGFVFQMIMSLFLF
ncbi:hypothetical protein H6G00_21935 [Leptolyngbya sp. FACHB-541]|uniref:hypothetical protein n=1 Tax=Leptolyngbya sp. FACHB-541 TaxID=2692810 RepID=UPI00168821B9|nr:hypothetical protein [Leptolyngbya sp. FACHB-541]MBD1999239.1 hypothetical protein [Leptolyngbya sp. FACHB-541]